MFATLASGFEMFLTPLAVGLTFMGILIGMLVGALPGLGPLMGIVLLLPFAIGMPPLAGMGFLIAIFVGGSCGGSVSAILLRIPGTPLAAATLLDGYPMAKKGRAADAIGIALAASALGGIAGGVVLIMASPTLARFASSFGPPEYTMLAITGLFTISLISEGTLVKGLMACAFGLLLSTVGTDEFSTGFRFTFDNPNLMNGFHIVAVVVGLFAVSEMAFQVMGSDLLSSPTIQKVQPGLGSFVRVLRHWPNLLRSSGIGVFFGSLPGAGGDISSFSAYGVAKAFSGSHENYGTGEEGGVVATEAANNATVGGALVPTLALGIPGDASSAMLLGAMLILGFVPGPLMFVQEPGFVGGIFLVYMLSNVFLLVAGIIAAPLFIRVLSIPKAYLIPAILILCCIGTFALQASVFDLLVMFAFGLVGMLFRLTGYPLSPVVLGLILGPILESNLRRSLLISREGYWIFLDRPVASALVVLNVLILTGLLVSSLRRMKKARGGKRALNP
ncbi:tripartite tricarboxylate transporter permease [Paracoccus sp. Z330]|uniref:Tripartite tricarboxylate transporter permease n=1 Tax=Paracoccus onchidii TaxID=3017813 RepID=A0ABT4ZGJ4_9RHOB|nr:tripartite tricarboxylate transporter permease [Paracoccus onchidii]MDB6178217.1 tripartite tricarboxylate transporter permease [Paracoccus onchidii]